MSDITRWTVSTTLRYGLPRRVLHFGSSPGDDVMITAVLHEWASRGVNKWWISSNFPDIFRDNAAVAKIVPADRRFAVLANLAGGTGRELRYAGLNKELDQTWPIPTEHILVTICRSAGLSGRIALRPYVKANQDDLPKILHDQNYIAFHSSGSSARLPMLTKEWFPDRLQAVMDHFATKLGFVQLGNVADPPIRGAVDLRGKTSISQSAAIIKNARVFLGQVGFLMHLARAVDTPSVIIYGGREAPWQSGYCANINLYSAIECAPCWYWNHCPFDRKCMRIILASHVIDAIESQLNIRRENLAVDCADLGSTPATVRRCDVAGI